MLRYDVIIKHRDPIMMWGVVLLGATVGGFLVAGIGLFLHRADFPFAMTYGTPGDHRQLHIRHPAPSLVLLTLSLGIGTVWLAVEIHEARRHAAAAQATAVADQRAQTQQGVYSFLSKGRFKQKRTARLLLVARRHA
jgi:hypothetical protein